MMINVLSVLGSGDNFAVEGPDIELQKRVMSPDAGSDVY